MKVVSNSALVSRRRRQATLLSIGGLATLSVGLYLSLARTELIAWAYGALIAGTILSWVGVAMTDAWLRPPRSDQAVESALKGAGRAFTLYSWVLPAEHVLLSPGGLTVLAVYKQEGPVTIKGDRWREERPIFRRLFSLGRRPVRNPRKVLDIDIEAMREVLEEDDELTDVPVQAAAVFVYPEIEMSVDEPSVPALRADELRDWLRTEGKSAQLSPARRRRLEVLLDGLAKERTE